jgi:type IV pilus assembly protein PilA
MVSSHATFGVNRRITGVIHARNFLWMTHMKRISKPNQRGFTLIELLVVMGIISTLIAVALPRYASYRASAYDSRAEMDLRSVAMAEEAYFLQNDRYLPCADASCATLPGIKRLSAGVTLAVETTDTGFRGTSSHPKGSGKVFTWNSDDGGMGR